MMTSRQRRLFVEQEEIADRQQNATDPVQKVNRTIKAIERLRDAAEDMEAAKFVIQQEYSDFSTGRRLDVLKSELINIISKSKEHLSKIAAESPEARTIVSKWLRL